MMRVSVDPERCCGAGLCAMNVPEVFDQNEDDATVLLLVTAPPTSLRARVRQAALTCPTGAITVEE
jgi:ferredoxin